IKTRLMGGDGVCTAELPKLAAGSLADDAVVCAIAGGVDASQRAALDKFKADYKKRFGTEVQIYSPYTYDATLAMADAMAKAGSAEPAKYLPVLAGNAYKGVTGTVAFDARGDIKNGALTLYTYRNGSERMELAVVR
uniref:ABC transporter substrate-binding protein n=1 Tax=Azohydromonas lata TaxID=45677 RepID=UPI000A9651E8